MSEEADSYDALEVEDSWIDYLRRRLPYSFLRIRREKMPRERRRPGRQYILSEPKLHASGEYHNFWRRGYAYYVAGKLTDTWNLARLWVDYRRLAHRPLVSGRAILQRDAVGKALDACRKESPGPRESGYDERMSGGRIVPKGNQDTCGAPREWYLYIRRRS